MCCVVLCCLVLCEVCCVRCVSVGCSRFSWVRPRFGRTPLSRTPPQPDTSSAEPPKFSLFFPSPATFFYLSSLFLGSVHIWVLSGCRVKPRRLWGRQVRPKQVNTFTGLNRSGLNGSNWPKAVWPKQVAASTSCENGAHRHRTHGTSFSKLALHDVATTSPPGAPSLSQAGSLSRRATTPGGRVALSLGGPRGG